jgi:hypothetical protein
MHQGHANTRKHITSPTPHCVLHIQCTPWCRRTGPLARKENKQTNTTQIKSNKRANEQTNKRANEQPNEPKLCRYRNGHAGSNSHWNETRWEAIGGVTQRRDLMVGDDVTSDNIKAGSQYAGALTEMDCEAMPTDTQKLLPKSVTVRLDADPTVDLAVGDDVMIGDTAQPNFRVVGFGAAGSLELQLEPINAQYVMGFSCNVIAIFGIV